jgi:acetolactate synthase-1/2/3 large subunit
MDMSKKMSGAKSLVQSLESAGVDVMFGLPGGAILPAYDPIFDSKIRHILVRHEQGAGHAATGYAQVTGRVGVCIATSGPGATNLVTPLADAAMDSVPMVAIQVKFHLLQLEQMHFKRLIFVESRCRLQSTIIW